MYNASLLIVPATPVAVPKVNKFILSVQVNSLLVVVVLVPLLNNILFAAPFTFVVNNDSAAYEAVEA